MLTPLKAKAKPERGRKLGVRRRQKRWDRKERERTGETVENARGGLDSEGRDGIGTGRAWHVPPGMRAEVPRGKEEHMERGLAPVRWQRAGWWGGQLTDDSLCG